MAERIKPNVYPGISIKSIPFRYRFICPSRAIRADAPIYHPSIPSFADRPFSLAKITRFLPLLQLKVEPSPSSPAARTTNHSLCLAIWSPAAFRNWYILRNTIPLFLPRFNFLRRGNFALGFPLFFSTSLGYFIRGANGGNESEKPDSGLMNGIDREATDNRNVVEKFRGLSRERERERERICQQISQAAYYQNGELPLASSTSAYAV